MAAIDGCVSQQCCCIGEAGPKNEQLANETFYVPFMEDLQALPALIKWRIWL